MLDCSLVTLGTVVHQGWVLMQYFEHGQQRSVSNIEESNLALNLVARNESLTFDLELKNWFFLWPESVDEIFTSWVGLHKPSSKFFCLFANQLVGVDAFFKLAKNTHKLPTYVLNIFV